MSDFYSHSSQQNRVISTKQPQFNQEDLTEAEINKQLINYTEEARRIDGELKQFELQMQQNNQKTWNHEEIAQKSQQEPQELKTPKRVQNRAHVDEIEMEQAREAKARRLVEQLLREREEEARFEMFYNEKEIHNNVYEMSKQQVKDSREFEMKQQEMNDKLEFARDNLEELKFRYEIEKNELDENDVRLDKICAQLIMTQDLAEKHNEERTELEEYIHKIGLNAGNKRENAKKLLGEYQRLQNEIAAQWQRLAREELELMEREYIVFKGQEARRDGDLDIQEEHYQDVTKLNTKEKPAIDFYQQSSYKTIESFIAEMYKDESIGVNIIESFELF